MPDKGKTTMGFNEIFAFGEGEIPDWVQQWEPVPEKTEMLFLATHPDDDILFLGSVIAWYGIEKQRNITVAYLTKSNTTRRSEALNGLWELGIRTYPVFGEFRDVYANPNRVSQSYKETGGKDKVQGWVTELYRQLKPEVVVTHHNHGRVLAAAVNLDTLCAVTPREDLKVYFRSEGYPAIEMDLSDLAVHPEEAGTTTALIRGVAAGMKEAGYRIGGFDAAVTSTVAGGSGLSSSAALEVMLTGVLDALYNRFDMPYPYCIQRT